MSDFYVTYNEP